MGMFDGIEDASSSKGGIYLLPGNYRLELKAVKTGTSRTKGDFFVTEFKILESTNPERPAGTTASWMTMARNESFLGNVKGFASAALGLEESKIQKKMIEEMTSDEQPLVGVEVLAQASNIVTRAGKDFTKVQWEPVEA